jgi:hypothetical protein
MMQITPNDLLAEAGQMALELRFKDQAITVLQARVAELEAAAAGDPAKIEPEAEFGAVAVPAQATEPTE